MAEAGSNLPSNSDREFEDDANIVTMVDVLKAEETLEENADAVLGPGDDKNCTHSKGYLKRQALYACLTCLPDVKDRAGVCLACSYHCHGDHDLVELYTKRNFRCDCGNSMFKGRACLLDPLKSGINENNSYNDNFRRIYCSCKRPYPDHENDDEDTMLQCIVCEDWFHTKHLGSIVPEEDEYSELICGPCTDKLPFLQYYLGYSLSKISKTEDKNTSDNNIDVTENAVPTKDDVNSTTPTSGEVLAEKSDAMAEETVKASEVTGEKENNTSEENKSVSHESKEIENEKKNNISDANKSVSLESKGETIDVVKSSSPAKEVACNEPESKEKDCLLKSLKKLPRASGASYWPENFRKLLCTCTTCLDMYKSHNVSFLTDVEDTIEAYEKGAKGSKKAVGATQYERGMEALSSLDRVQQMEAILSYNEMKTHLSEYLAKFVENKKVVREEDIREFFSGMQARKRQKLDIPHNCR